MSLNIFTETQQHKARLIQTHNGHSWSKEREIAMYVARRKVTKFEKINTPGMKSIVLGQI